MPYALGTKWLSPFLRRSKPTDLSPSNGPRFVGPPPRRVTGASWGSPLLTIWSAPAPAQAEGQRTNSTWSHFTPPHVWFDKFAAQWGEKNGVKVRVDHIPHLEIPARMAAEFAAGTGHDLILNNSTILARLYYKSLVDMTDIYDQLGKKYGGWIPAAKSPIEVEGRIYGIPMYYILLPISGEETCSRRRAEAAPTRGDWRGGGANLSRRATRPGMAFSPLATTRTSTGGSVMFTSVPRRPTRPAQRHDRFEGDARSAPVRQGDVRQGMTAEVFSWDDASDNRFPRVRQSQAGITTPSRLTARRIPEPGGLQEHVHRQRAGRAAGKRVSVSAPIVFLGWKFLEEPPAVKEVPGPPRGQRKEGMIQSTGYNMPFLNDNAKKPMPIIGADPKMQVLQDFPKIVAFFGYPGPYTPQIQEVANLFILPDIFTRVARGESIDASLNWGVGEYRRIFAKHKRA